MLILISNVTLSSNNSVSESKLLDDNLNQQVIPETTDDIIQEIPEIPAIENIPTTSMIVQIQKIDFSKKLTC